MFRAVSPDRSPARRSSSSRPRNSPRRSPWRDRPTVPAAVGRARTIAGWWMPPTRCPGRCANGRWPTWPGRARRCTAARRDGRAAAGYPPERRLEVYLLRRAGSMAFAAGMHVFPGGSVDPRDGDALDRVGRARARRVGPAARLRRAARPGPGLRRGARDVRGVGRAAGRAVGRRRGRPTPRQSDWERDRLALLDRSLSMSGLLERRGLVLRSDLLGALRALDHPGVRAAALRHPVLRRRRCRPVSGRATSAARPTHATGCGVADAVRAHEAGRLAMLPPTIEALRELAAVPRRGRGAGSAARRCGRSCRGWSRPTAGRLRLVVE